MRGNASRSIEEAQRSRASGRIRPAATMFRRSGHTPSGLELTEKPDRDARDRIDLEGDRLLVRLYRERRHHRPGDDDFSAAQPLAEGREHVGDVAHDADPLPGIALRIASARELACAPNDAASEAVGRAAGARRSAAIQHHVALIDVGAENALGILGRRGEIDDLDCRRDAGDRGLGGRLVGAGGDVAADVHGDFGLGHGLDPAGKRYAPSRLNAGSARQKSHQRPGDVEALEHRRRGEADLPAQRRVAGVETLAPQRELRPHAAYDARVLPEVHDPVSIIWAKRRAETSMIVRSYLVAGALDRAGAHPAPYQHHVRVRSVVEAVPALARRIDDVAFTRRGLAVVGVDMAVALEHDEELVAIVMAVPLVARPRLEHGPTDHMVGAGGGLVDQELHLHVDPAVLAFEARDLRHVAHTGAIHFRGLGCRAPAADPSFALSHGSLHGSCTSTRLVGLIAAARYVSPPRRR